MTELLLYTTLFAVCGLAILGAFGLMPQAIAIGVVACAVIGVGTFAG